MRRRRHLRHDVLDVDVLRPADLDRQLIEADSAVAHVIRIGPLDHVPLQLGRQRLGKLAAPELAIRFQESARAQGRRGLRIVAVNGHSLEPPYRTQRVDNKTLAGWRGQKRRPEVSDRC